MRVWMRGVVLGCLLGMTSGVSAAEPSSMWVEPWFGEDWLRWTEGCPVSFGRGPVTVSPSFFGVFPDREQSGGSGFMVDVGCFVGPALEVGAYFHNDGGFRFWLAPELTANFVELSMGPTFEFDEEGKLWGVGGQVSLSLQFWVGVVLLSRLTPERKMVYEVAYRFGF